MKNKLYTIMSSILLTTVFQAHASESDDIFDNLSDVVSTPTHQIQEIPTFIFDNKGEIVVEKEMLKEICQKLTPSNFLNIQMLEGASLFLKHLGYVGEAVLLKGNVQDWLKNLSESLQSLEESNVEICFQRNLNDLAFTKSSTLWEGVKEAENKLKKNIKCEKLLNDIIKVLISINTDEFEIIELYKNKQLLLQSKNKERVYIEKEKEKEREIIKSNGKIKKLELEIETLHKNLFEAKSKLSNYVTDNLLKTIKSSTSKKKNNKNNTNTSSQSVSIDNKKSEQIENQKKQIVQNEKTIQEKTKTIQEKMKIIQQLEEQAKIWTEEKKELNKKHMEEMSSQKQKHTNSLKNLKEELSKKINTLENKILEVNEILENEKNKNNELEEKNSNLNKKIKEMHFNFSTKVSHKILPIKIEGKEKNILLKNNTKQNNTKKPVSPKVPQRHITIIKEKSSEIKNIVQETIQEKLQEFQKETVEQLNKISLTLVNQKEGNHPESIQERENFLRESHDLMEQQINTFIEHINHVEYQNSILWQSLLNIAHNYDSPQMIQQILSQHNINFGDVTPSETTEKIEEKNNN